MIGYRIAAAREKQGLNQSELARLLGVKPQSVQAWESNKNTPRPQRLINIAATLKISISDLLSEASAEKTSSPAKKLPDTHTSDSEEDSTPGLLLPSSFRKLEIYNRTNKTINLHEGYLAKLGIENNNSENLSIITAWDQSMEKTIDPRDLILIDQSIKKFTGEGIYLITWADHLFIKRLHIASKNKIEIISDNSNHKTRVVPLNRIKIHARALVIWKAKPL